MRRYIVVAVVVTMAKDLLGLAIYNSIKAKAAAVLRGGPAIDNNNK